MYSHKQVISNGIKYFINFGRYLHFSKSVIGKASVVELLSIEWSLSINDVVDAEPDADEAIAFASRINRKATISTSGMASISSNMALGLKRKSHNVA